MFRCERHLQGAHYLSLLKLTVKYIDVINSIVWLHILLLGPS